MKKTLEQGRIINVFSNKGGVGKTTTVLNLGHALAKEGYRTVVFDVDSQCNCTIPLLGEEIAPNLVDLLTGEKSIQDCVYPVEFQSNLFCVPNSYNLISLEPQLIRQGEAGFSVFRDKVADYVRNKFDITLVDNPPNHGIFTINSNYAADLAIVPTVSGSKNSMKGLQKAIQFIAEIQQDGNPGLKFLRMLVTQTDKRTSIDREYLEHIHNVFKNQAFDTHIPVNVAFKYAEDKGKTIFQYDPKAPGAKAYKELASEIIGLLGI